MFYRGGCECESPPQSWMRKTGSGLGRPGAWHTRTSSAIKEDRLGLKRGEAIPKAFFSRRTLGSGTLANRRTHRLWTLKTNPGCFVAWDSPTFFFLIVDLRSDPNRHRLLIRRGYWKWIRVQHTMATGALLLACALLGKSSEETASPLFCTNFPRLFRLTR